jgi:flagellum-specific ATP synthase
MLDLEPQIQTVRRLQPLRLTGRVQTLRGMSVLVRDMPMPIGALVRVERGGIEASDESAASSLGEVVGFDGELAIVMMLGLVSGIRAGDCVVGLHPAQTVGVGASLIGRVVNGLGEPIDGKGSLHATTPRLIDPEPIGPMARRRITEPLYTGLRAMDLMTTLGRGQRLGVFAGPGVGKSTLLGSAARNTSADVSVVALIGERGREVRDFIDHTLGPEGMKRCVVVVATSDESPLLRARAAMTACTIAEHFRDADKDVLLIMDSITRFAHAQRQIGLSVGEPPATRGYTPSVFAAMARLLERAGAMLPRAGSAALTGRGGSITGLYSILVEGDDMTEPIADAARGILDGHVILSRALAQRAHFPAIDVLDSISRVADDVTDAAHAASRRQLIKLLAAYKNAEDLIQIGAYAKGSSPVVDTAIRYQEQITALLQQGSREQETFAVAKARMVKLALDAGATLAQLSAGRKG